eukprot:TRINITY_DN2867_c0_g1_i1.p1 TRINITY_DN2867_c0_g1~~TRINITY_DN2867_c0_g1_i1.p1  ORF type:complete len:159 (-),score=14.89 TRINITY_DN2867_c0_g1_i1:19-495(-)
MNLPFIPDDLNLQDDDMIPNLDDKTVKGINGCRVTDTILSLVPDIDTFRTALRVVKIWGKCRGVYSNVMGYLGGVSWAMLTARICQLYPNAAPSQIILRFFIIWDCTLRFHRKRKQKEHCAHFFHLFFYILACETCDIVDDIMILGYYVICRLYIFEL